ncbi:hypothetical protein [Spongiactinospora sp. 9N601]|uniref:hypothetical protein n=1 Tax=Spongiactinospora sp. 9N601 TaxID=3375149 RepID=UPI00378AD3F7
METTEQVVAQARTLIEGRCSLSELLHFLKTRESLTLTPFNFLRVLHEAAGIPLTLSQELLEMLDCEMMPMEPSDEVEREWIRIIDTLE